MDTGPILVRINRSFFSYSILTGTNITDVLKNFAVIMSVSINLIYLILIAMNHNINIAISDRDIARNLAWWALGAICGLWVCRGTQEQCPGGGGGSWGAKLPGWKRIWVFKDPLGGLSWNKICFSFPVFWAVLSSIYFYDSKRQI